MHRLPRRHRAPLRRDVPTRVGVAIVTRVVAAAHLHADPMAAAEQHAGGPQLDRDLGRGLGRLRIGPTENAVGNVVGIAVRMDIDQLDGEVGAGGIGGDVENERR